MAPNDVRSLTLLTDLSNRLAVYTGMIATARANNRAGRPIGVAYLSAASALMQRAILPSVEQLYRSQADAVGSSERSAGPSRAAIALSVFTHPVGARTDLPHQTQPPSTQPRPGAGIRVMVALAGWLSVAGLLSEREASDARTRGSEPLATVVTARILAQQARADEILGLLKRPARKCFTPTTPRSHDFSATQPHRRWQRVAASPI